MILNSTCHHFNDLIKTEDCDSDKILIDEKSYKNVLVYNISYKTLIGAIPMHIRSNKVDGFIRVYDVTRYLKLFELGKYQETSNRIR